MSTEIAEAIINNHAYIGNMDDAYRELAEIISR